MLCLYIVQYLWNSVRRSWCFQVAAAQETLAGLSLTVTELENSFNMGRDDWWEQLLSWLVLQGEEMELLSRIRDDLLENRVPGQESLINR